MASLVTARSGLTVNFTLVLKAIADLVNMKLNVTLLVIFVNLVFLPVMAGGAYQLLPADEANRDLEFVEFRARMIEAVENKEPEVLVTMIAPRVFNGLNEKRGMKRFLEKWEPESVDSELWSTLKPILTMGGGFVRSEKGVEFCAPYVFSHFPDDMDIFAHGAVISENVALKKEPSVKSKTLRSLSYDLVQVQDWVSTQDKANEAVNWIKVVTMKGDAGYVNRRFVRSPSDYSACFLKTKRRGWKLNSLLSGE